MKKYRKMWHWLRWFRLSALWRSAAGMNLIEVLIAVAVLGFITVSVPTALIMITNNQFKWNEQRVAENITRNTIEYIKVQAYDSAADGNVTYKVANLPLPNDDWAILYQAIPIDPWSGAELVGQDKGIQKLIITIKHVGKEVLKTVAYKIDPTPIYFTK